MKTYPDIVAVDSVIVFEPGDNVPTSAEVLGNVAVVDKGNTTKCKYDYVLELAKTETSKVGGNGLAIVEHITPSFWGSSCHQIRGVMLHLTDMEIDDNSTPLNNSMAITNNKFIEEQAEEHRAPKNTITVSMGYGVITSKIYNYSNGEVYNSKGGLDWRIQYERIYNKGIGFGLMYSGFKTSFPDIEGNVMLSYFAPSFVGAYKTKAWILRYGLGIGYFHYNEKFYSTGGVGFNYDLSAEYMISENIGLGFTMSGISSSLNQDIDLPGNERHGINRINFLGGLRFYF